MQIEFILGRGITTGCFPMRSQPGCGNVLFVTRRADVRSLIVVKSLVKLEMNELRELGRTEVTSIRFLTRMKPHMGFQVGCG